MSKTIVVYYSVQGHVKKIAEKIAELKSADIFAIEAKQPYTEADLNYMDEGSRATKEFNNPELRDIELVSTEVPGWADYDTVILCYPIWWAIAAWGTNSFVKAVDWNGKKVFPIAISHSSPAGESGYLLEDDANGGEWQEAVRVYQDATDDEIKSAIGA